MRLTPKQKEYWLNANNRWNIKTGATRSGKTWLDYYLIPRRIRERIGKDGTVVLLGNTQATLWRNVIEPMQKLYGERLVSNIKANNQVELFGETCYALGADKISQVKRIQGASFKYCYGDEVATWSQSVFDMLKSRLDKPYSCFDGTLNPEGQYHWFKKEFLDKVETQGLDAFVQSYCIDDNPMLDPAFVESLKKEYFGTVLYPRYIEGKWTNAEGLLFPQYAAAPQNWRVDKVPSVMMVNIGVDIGGTKSHTAIETTGILTGYKGVITFSESRVQHAKGTIDTDRICQAVELEIRKVMKMGYLPRAVFVDNAEQIIINTMTVYLRRRGISTAVLESKKYEGMTRVLAYTLLFNLGKIKFKDVPNIEASLATAMYDGKAKEDKILDDFTTDIDTFDAHFYSFSYFLEQLGVKG